MSELIKVCNQNEYTTAHKVDWKVFDNWNECFGIYFNKLEAIKKYQTFQTGNESISMIECYESNLDDINPVQDFLLKKDLPAQLHHKSNMGLAVHFAWIIDTVLFVKSKSWQLCFIFLLAMCVY